jgi:hypothetical protein
VEFVLQLVDVLLVEGVALLQPHLHHHYKTMQRQPGGSEESEEVEGAEGTASREDLEKCKDLIRAVVNMKLDFEQAKYMFAVMK